MKEPSAVRRVALALWTASALLTGCLGDDAADGGPFGGAGASASGATAGDSEVLGSTGAGPDGEGGEGNDGTGVSDTTAGGDNHDDNDDAGTTTNGDDDDAGTTTNGDDNDDNGDNGDAGTTTDDATGSTGGGMLSDDPFDPEACQGVPWTAADATNQLGGLPRQILAGATIQVRTRTCPGGACGAWGDGEDWYIHYLTWSGGVVTAYKDFLADMDLVLFDDAGTPRLSMQHVTFPTGGYPDDDGVVYDFPPDVVNYPHLRAYDDDPDSRYYYVDLDYQVSEGELVLGDGCAVWTAFPFGLGQPHTAQYGAVFHW